MFHVSIFSLLIVSILSTPYTFGKSGPTFEMKSSRDHIWLQMSITIYGGEGTQFIIISQVLSDNHKQHMISLIDGQIKIFPQIDKQNILFRDHHDNKYFLAFKHEIGLKKIHFTPIKISHQEEEHQFFLPTFDLSTPFLPQATFYRCDQVLVSLQHMQPKSYGEQQYLEVLMFTKNMKEHNFYLDDKWNRTWRHYDDGIYFGGAIEKQNIHDLIKIYLSNRKVCEIDIDELPHPGDNVDLKKYYLITDLLKWAPSLHLTDLVLDDQL